MEVVVVIMVTGVTVVMEEVITTPPKQSTSINESAGGGGDRSFHGDGGSGDGGGNGSNTQHKRHCLVCCRLVPAMGYVMWACTSLLPLLGSGPVWERTYQALFGRPCANTAWANLLFLNNFNDPSDMVDTPCPLNFALYCLM